MIVKKIGINYNKIKGTVEKVMQLEQKLENGEEQCEGIQIVSLSGEEVLNKINSGGYVYNIDSGLVLTLCESLRKKRKKKEKK